MNAPRVPLVPAWMRWSAVAVVAAAIFSLSVLAAPPEDPFLPKPDPFALDKWRHFLAYGALSATLAYALADRPWRTATVIAVGVGLTVVYGVGIEGVQSLLPNRYFSIGDALANAIGGALATPLYLALRRTSFERVPVDVSPSGLEDE